MLGFWFGTSKLYLSGIEIEELEEAITQGKTPNCTLVELKYREQKEDITALLLSKLYLSGIEMGGCWLPILPLENLQIVP